MVEHDQFVRVLGIAGLPCRDLEICQLDRFIGRVVRDPLSQDDRFQQGIAGQTVGSVQTGAGDLADGIQTGDRSASVDIGFDTAALVVRRRNDRDGFLGHIHTAVIAVLVNVGETLHQETGGFVSDVQADMIRAVFLHFFINGARHDIPGCQRKTGIVVLHELGAVQILEDSTFAADGLADEERAALGIIKTGGMELDEFHVGNGCARAPRHRQTIAGRDIGIGRVKIDLAAAASGQNDVFSLESRDLVGIRVQSVNADTAFLVRRQDQVNGEMMLEKLDILLPRSRVQQGSFDLMAGDVASMKDAALGVTAFAPQIQLTGTICSGDRPLGERCSIRDQIRDAAGTFGHDGAHDAFIAQTGTGDQSIPDVHLEAILFGSHGRDAALGLIGVGIGARFFGDDRDPAVPGGFQREK